jgi:hypothetical protein
LIDRKKIAEVVLQRAVIFSLILMLVGLTLLYLSTKFEEWQWPIRTTLTREFGAFCLVSFILGLWWDFIGRRSFADEILSKVGMSRDLELAGITTVAMDFRDSRIDWRSMFSTSTRLDIWMSYGSTWRNSHLSEIEQFLQVKGNLLQVAVPNPDDARMMDTLAERFSEDATALQGKVKQTIRDFQSLATGATGRGKVKIYLASSVPLFTFYRFNNLAILAFYNHRKGRSPVPTLVCRKEGTLYQYIVEEFAHLASGGPIATEPTV